MVEVQRRKVILKGTVRSWAEKQGAQHGRRRGSPRWRTGSRSRCRRAVRGREPPPLKDGPLSAGANALIDS
jgi:hypothetical protein